MPMLALVAATSLLWGASVAAAQDVQPIPPPVTPSTRPAQTPERLIDKSIRDLSHGAVGAAVKDDVKALRRGPLLIHGNYCGIGGRRGTAPIDALDAACMRHDACTKTGTLPTCACDDRLRLDATAIAEDARTPAEEKTVAAATASAMAVLICKVAPHG